MKTIKHYLLKLGVNHEHTNNFLFTAEPTNIREKIINIIETYYGDIDTENTNLKDDISEIQFEFKNNLNIVVMDRLIEVPAYEYEVLSRYIREIN